MQPEKCFHSDVSPYSLIGTEPDAGIVVNLSIELINVPPMTLVPLNPYPHGAGVNPFAFRPLRAPALEAELF